jgi:hypothetical protein
MSDTELIDHHWEFIRALMLQCGVEPSQREEFLFREGMKHGLKHGRETK